MAPAACPAGYRPRKQNDAGLRFGLRELWRPTRFHAFRGHAAQYRVVTNPIGSTI